MGKFFPKNKKKKSVKPEYENNALLELSAIVRGNVQGVGFRAIAKSFADQLGLKGFVRNLPDRNVEICAQGKKQQLEMFLSELKREFPSRYIEKIDCVFRPIVNFFVDFKIMR